MDLWEHQPGEPTLWYNRFHGYLLIGPQRSIEKAFNLAKRTEHFRANRPGAAWYAAAEGFQWAKRAVAWDEAQRIKLRENIEQERFDEHRRRLGLISNAINWALNIVELADLPNLDVMQAREMLPTIRLLLKDMLTAQRVELGLPAAQESQSAIAPFTADELAQARRELGDNISTKIGDSNKNVIVGKDISQETGNQIINIYTQKK